MSEATEAEPAELYEGELDGALFEALVSDLSTLVRIVSVHVKGAAEERAEETEVTLEKARMLLVLGRVRGVRIHYEHEGVEWIDTLMRGPRSIRLVRMRVPGVPEKTKRRLRIVD